MGSNELAPETEEAYAAIASGPTMDSNPSPACRSLPRHGTLPRRPWRAVCPSRAWPG